MGESERASDIQNKRSMRNSTITINKMSLLICCVCADACSINNFDYVISTDIEDSKSVNAEGLCARIKNENARTMTNMRVK